MNVWNSPEYWMYFKRFKLHSRVKRTGQVRRHNWAALSL